MEIKTIITGSTLVSSATPDRSTHRWEYAYTGLFQRRSKRIEVPVKCYYVNVNGHSVLIDAGWSKEVVVHPLQHLGFGLWFASEPVMKNGESAKEQLTGQPIDAILMTHLDCDHVSGLRDFSGIDIYTSAEEIAFATKKKMRYGRLVKGYDFRHFVFKDDIQAPFDQSCDVFGDSSVIAYLTPTHSAGSVIYRISDANGFALIVGDNGYMKDSWQKGILPGPLYHAENMKHCLKWIKEQSERHDCLGVYCAHERDGF